jgi:hypothetical protein
VASPGHHEEPIEGLQNLLGAALLVRESLAHGMQNTTLNAALVASLEYLLDRRRQVQCMKPERLADFHPVVGMKFSRQRSEFDISPMTATRFYPHPFAESRNLRGIIQEGFGVIGEWEGHQPPSSDPALHLAKDNSVI